MTAATTLRRARCLIGGHPDRLVQWGAWKSDEECGRYRVLTERCARCDAVLAYPPPDGVRPVDAAPEGVMNAADLRPCLCGCARTFNRPESMPLCKPASTRAWAVCRSLYGDADLCEQGRINARFWVDERTVAAALRGDLTEVMRRVECRAKNFRADPDRVLVGA